MDSIFQIKINENKLHRILTQFNKDQQKLEKEMSESLQQIKNLDFNLVKWKKDLEGKINQVFLQLSKSHSTSSQSHNQSIRQIKNSLSQTAQSLFMKHSKIQENMTTNQKQISRKNDQLEQKINQLSNNLSEVKKKQFDEEKFLEKVNTLQKTINKMVDVTEILQNKNFLYFLQLLVDRQTGGIGNIRISQILKQTKNPLIHQPNQQRSKRYKDVKRILHETQNKIQSMQTQYTGYFNTATETNKQNREQTHMHYAVLSTKIKQIENKLSEQQQVSTTQNQCEQKIIYPSEFNIREKGKRKNKRNNSYNLNNLNESFSMERGKENEMNVEEEIRKIKSQTQKQRKQLKLKMEKMEDEVWTNNSKVTKIKQFCKTQVDKMNEKIRAITHYAQFTDRQSNPNSCLNTSFIQQFRNLQQDVEQKLKQKIDISLYKRHQQQNYQKNKILSEQIEMKANKDEIRKALTFIEQKIKQIVTLIANMQNTNHKTAGRKMIVQCLSCDDNFFYDLPQNLQQNQHSSSAITPNSTQSSPRFGCNFTLKKQPKKIKHEYRKSNIQQ